MSEAYQYQKLTSSEIRLLRVAGIRNDIIIAQAQNFQTEQTPEYTALSYRWGHGSRRCAIELDGQHISITRRLKEFLLEVTSRQATARQAQLSRRSALRVLNDPSLRRWVSIRSGREIWDAWFWIDAICINQDDVIERNEQVRKMKETFENARRVIIWLGVAGKETADAFHMLQRISVLSASKYSLQQSSTSEQSYRIGDDTSSVVISQSLMNGGLARLLRSEYWSRTWIIQESTTPKSDKLDESEMVICCGDETLSWGSFNQAITKLNRATPRNGIRCHPAIAGLSQSGRVYTLRALWNSRRNNSLEGLYNLLLRTRSFEAADPRDKLYAVLGLARERDEKSLQPDYSQSVETVYTRLATTIIGSDQSLDTLGSAGLVRIHNLPSWVTDWACYDEVPVSFPIIRDDIKPPGRCGRIFDADRSHPHSLKFLNDDRCLVARGCQYDVVQEFGPPRSGFDAEQELWDSWYHFADSVLSSLGPTIATAEILSKVLVADIKKFHLDQSACRGGEIRNFQPSTNHFATNNPRIEALTDNRRLLTTSKGHLALGPKETEPGDRVCILFGSQYPVVLRPEEDHWLFVGQAYVHGIMDGEAVEGFDMSQAVEFKIW